MSFCRISLNWIIILLAITVPHTQGGCEFKKSWIGRWFQHGVENLLYINATFIATKGECHEEEGDKGDKYILYDRSEDCYRCMVIHEKHQSVLQYKESYCESKGSLKDICEKITGDASLYSLYRKHPEAKPVQCPFKSAPFTFSYNRGAGECSNPPSTAESCTDDSRLVLKYQSCPDVASTESNVEELVCLATWKEGSTRYLIGRITQGNRRNLVSDEDQYRCFIYERRESNGKTVYHVAQSGEASCSGVLSAYEGSKSMTLTSVDNHHNRCKFPMWITEHHTWLSLDHHKTYKFSQRNATLKILDDEPTINNNNNNNKLKFHNQQQQQQQNFAQFSFQEFGFQSQDQRRSQNNEMRVVCHNSYEYPEEKKVKIVAHVTAGCDSGYACMMFYKRDSNIIEIQQSERFVENPDDACNNFDTKTVPFTTLITTTLHSKKCPHIGRYTITNKLINNHQKSKRRRKREQTDDFNNIGTSADCLTHDYEALAVGCGSSHEMEFRSTCAQQSISAYLCHGSWEENGIFYVITSPVARKSTDALRYCFIYTLTTPNQLITDSTLFVESGSIINNGLTNSNNFKGNGILPILRLSSVSESCHRYIMPGINGSWAFNFTSNGTCAESNAENHSQALIASTFIILWSVIIIIVGFYIR